MPSWWAGFVVECDGRVQVSAGKSREGNQTPDLYKNGFRLWDTASWPSKLVLRRIGELGSR